MENIKHLIEVLKSQVNLYSELSELMDSEKQAIVSWSIDKTLGITKKKDMLMRKERIQSEARNALLSKIALEQKMLSVKITDVIDILRTKQDGEDAKMADELASLCSRIVELVKQVHAENISLKMLYATNSRLINDFFTQTGLAGTAAGYGPNGSQNRVSTIHRVG